MFLHCLSGNKFIISTKYKFNDFITQYTIGVQVDLLNLTNKLGYKRGPSRIAPINTIII